MKNFYQAQWTECLAKQNWETIGATEDIDKMVQDLSSCMTIALDEIAPIKLKDAWVLPSFGFSKVASISRQLLIASVARWRPPDGDINLE